MAVASGYQLNDCLFFYVDLRSDGQEISTVPVKWTSKTLNTDAGLDDGRTMVAGPEPQPTLVRVNVRPSDFGREHELTVMADPEMAFEEPDEHNNSVTVILSLPARDTVDPVLACPPEPTSTPTAQGGSGGTTPPGDPTDPAVSQG
ncbi:hypothetical protein ACIP9X_21650 [Arthrobacter sp. NPDC093125]|uniref:hypothetical protein n=1 Tax=Arthrobacter sp. NPDC093125 TaxID=3363944 RepID=UPI0038192F04